VSLLYQHVVVGLPGGRFDASGRVDGIADNRESSRPPPPIVPTTARPELTPIPMRSDDP
jgi:hypothetical protein